MTSGSGAFLDREAGFSLVELCACLVILGVLAAAGGPTLFNTQPFDERGYIDELAAALRYASGVAVATGCNVSVTVNGAGYSAMQQQPSGNTCAPAGLYTIPVVRSDGTPLAGSPPADANVVAGATIIFGTNGQVANAPAPALAVGTFTLTLDPISGFVTVQ
jgi:prepilin-type N-terminal cleavage/methylation domain-containing protein